MQRPTVTPGRRRKTLLTGIAVLAVAAGVLLAGCVVAPGPIPDPSSPTPSPPSASAASAPTTHLVLNPVDYGGVRVVVATFREPVEGRQVDLQQRSTDGWNVAATGSQDSSGRVEFRVPYANAEYRAVALETADGGHPEMATKSMKQSDEWRLDFREEFSQSSLPTENWSPRQTAQYFGARLCSAPYPTGLKVRDGSFRGTIREASAERTREVEIQAAPKLGVPASQACPNGVWDAAMVSTEGRYTFRYGVAAVRAKFPTEPGIHGSVWLQSVERGGVEVDFIETFGPKYGIQHKVHYMENGVAAATGGYVKSLPQVKTDAWWDEYHVFSVEWTADELVFRVDGTETFRTRAGVSKGEQFIILSLLASDWELERIDPDEMPATMAVDWVRVWQQK